MTKFLSVFVAGLACLLAAGGNAHAVPRLVAGVVRGFPGRTVEVPVSLRYRTNDVRDVVALQADVLFDATGVADGAPVSGGILTNHVLASSSPATGTRRLLVYSPASTVLTNGDVARIPFNVAPNEYRNFSLRFTNVILVRADASQVFGTTVNGAIAVNQVFLAPDGHADGFLNVASNGVEQCYIIQATTDFVSWVNVQTNNTEGGLLDFADPAAVGHPKRFYRAIVCDGVSGLQIGTITQLANVAGCSLISRGGRAELHHPGEHELDTVGEHPHERGREWVDHFHRFAHEPRPALLPRKSGGVKGSQSLPR